MASIVASILLALHATAGEAAIPASERQVLLNIYTSTNGANWTNKTNWNGAVGTECTWYGIVCNAGGTNVTQVNLQENHLTGSLPAISGLTNLQYFNVWNNEPIGSTSNQLSGSIPALTSLTGLIQFAASRNQLTGSFPTLTGLSNLQFISVNKNQLSGPIPALTGLSSLKTFWANDNQLSGSIPLLTGLTTLQDIRLTRNQVSGSIPALTGLTNLQIFALGSNKLTGSIPALAGLTSLQEFYVWDNQLTGSIPALAGLISLQKFLVEDNSLTGPIPALTGLSSLQEFRVEYNQLTGNVPAVPSPNALVAGASDLCPNALNATPDAAWDIATGSFPWYSACAAPVPSVSTTPATNVTSNGATVNGIVSSNGASTTVSFQYGLTASYGGTVTAAQSPLAAGASNASVSATLGGLTCNTLYHFRAVGENSAGTSYGANQTFTTGSCLPGGGVPPPPPPPKPTVEQLVRFADAAYGNATAVEGYSEIPVLAAPADFSVKAFRSSAGDRIVVAIAGTDEPFDLLGTDRSFLDSTPSPTLRDYVTYATDVVRALATSYPGVELTFTGHSLGGAIAQMLASARGVNATAFNAPGAAPLMAALQSTLSTLPALKQPSGAPELVNYRLYGDLISTLGTPLGTTLTLIPPAPLSTGLIDDAPLEYAKAMHLLSTVQERLDSHASTTTALGPTAASAQRLLATTAPQGGKMGFAPVGVNATDSYFIDPQGVDLYTLISDPGSPFFKSIKFPFLLNTDAVFRLEQLVNGEWTSLGTFGEQETRDLGALGADQLRFFVLDRNTQRAPAKAVEPFVFGVKFATAGTLKGTLSAQSTTGPSLNQHGFTGSWYEPASSGQGLLIEVFPDLTPGEGRVFVAWFTYDTAAGGAERQRWYTLQGPLVNGQPSAPLTIYQNTGGNFNAPPATTSQAVGTATLRFDSCTSGELSYSFNDGRSGTIALTRLTPNVSCAAAAPYPTNADFMLSGSWYGGAATSGQGLLADVAVAANRFFLAWFTYLPNGASAGAAGQRWYSAQGPFTAGQRTIPVEIQETTGGAFDTPTSASQHTVPVGSGTMVFHSCAAATFSYTFTGGSHSGLSGSINLGRIGPLPPGCAN
jgi:hypothetical protein